MKEKENKELAEMDDFSLEEQIEVVAGCNYTIAQMALYFSEVMSPKQFKEKAQDPDSIIYLAIQRGRLKTDFAISFQQKNLAESGNITAVQVFEKLKEQKRVEELKNKIYFGA